MVGVPITSGATKSAWIDVVKPLSFSRPASDRRFDVVIVGGGIAGLSVAYFLSRAGKKVAVAESRFIGSGETGRTTAHLVNALDDRYYELRGIMGDEGARLACESHTAAIDVVERIVREENIDCDFERVNGYLFLSRGDKKELLEKELDALRAVGMTGAEIVNNPEGTRLGPALMFPAQGQFHPMKYLKGLSSAIKRSGGEIFTSTHVAEVTKKGVKTADGVMLHASSVVVCTNTPINDRVTMHTKQAPYRTYVIAALCKKNAKPALFWDTAESNNEWPYPYHYVRYAKYNRANDLIIIGGEDHKTGQAFDAKQRYKNLIQWGRKHFRFGKVVYAWSGQVMEPFDALAYIGRNPGSRNIYIATGDSGNGMTHGTIAGVLISDLILGNENKWARIYDPVRKPIKNLFKYANENINVAKQYGDRLKHKKYQHAAIPVGEGNVIEHNSEKVALFLDKDGFHEFSAICPHLGCVVRWNSDEKTFDCPCHGSRFTGLGRVVNGPANRNLQSIGGETMAKKRSMGSRRSMGARRIRGASSRRRGARTARTRSSRARRAKGPIKGMKRAARTTARKTKSAGRAVTRKVKEVVREIMH